MKKKSFYLVLALVITGAASVNAQVLIGGNGTGNPHAGSILDLASGGQNNLGLLLPNVALNDDATVFTLGSGVAPDPATATGMIVYNTAALPYGGRGVYVWDGSKWVPIVDPCPSLVYDEKGNDYFTGWFGKAGCWMTQNMRYTDATLTENRDPEDYNAKCYTYPGDASILTTHPEYGLFYTWAAATGRTEIDSESEDANPSGHPLRGICPSGWHVPSDKEWNDLEEVIAESAQGVYSEDGTTTTWNNMHRTTTAFRANHGRKMKSKKEIGEFSTNGLSKASDENGFNALLVGDVTSGDLNDDGVQAIFWSSTSASSDNAWARSLNRSNDGVARYAFEKIEMYSVRCKQDN
jgi:uncharacterized protein (TIGR02145 family)